MDAIVAWGALAVIVLTYMILWYGLFRVTGRLDVVDSAWGLGFVLIAWVSLVIAQNFSAIAVTSACLASVWGIRLFAHIANRNWRKPADDRRYQELRAKWGRAANSKALTHIFLLQGVLLLLVGTPLVAIAHSGDAHTNALTLVGWAVWFAGILYESVADYQLTRFIRQRPHGSHALMTSGLWRYSRHPNYFGEVTAWLGAGLVAISLGQWWGILGTFVITFLITKVSGIPPLEKHYAGNAEYQKYAKYTPVLVPFLKP